MNLGYGQDRAQYLLLNQIDRLDYLLPLCAFAAGAVDIIGFGKLGGVFPSATTGNFALPALYSAAGSIRFAIG